MLTICIPIYNYDSIRLISDLNNQADNLECPVEIVVINDGSKPEFNNLYNCLVSPIIRYISLPQNIGRAKVRNLFVSFAKYDYLLFLDCDDKIIADHYLKQYISQIFLG